MANVKIGEVEDILRIMPIEQLKIFAKMRLDKDIWPTFQQFAKDQRQIKLDQIYRLRRPRTEDDLIKNAVEHEYYAARIAGLVVILQLMENASNELERRERKEK